MKRCGCGAVLSQEHILSNLVGIQEGADGEKAAILFDCVCRSTIALRYEDAPPQIREAADRIEESRGLFAALGQRGHKERSDVMSTAGKKIKQQAAAFPVPQTHDQVVEAIAEIGRRQRERDRIQAEMNDELAIIKARYEEGARPHAEAIRELSEGVHIYCEAHRDELTQGAKVKTANLSSGEVRWRMRPPSVALKGIDKILEALRKFGLSRFIRTKEEVDRQAILAEPEAVKGVSGIKIVQEEDFVIVPFETELEEIA